MSPAAAANRRATVLGTYRNLLRYVRRLPEDKRMGPLSQLRDGYRENASAPAESVPDLIEEAGKKIAFLRISTPKSEWAERGLGGADGQAGTTRWVYRSGGEKEEGGEGTAFKTGRVVSNFDGKNLDPCHVKRHKQNLKRAGFVNNLHAKGIF